MLKLTLVSGVSQECVLTLVSIECMLGSLSTVPIRIGTVCEPISFSGFVRIDGISTDKGLPLLSDIVHASLHCRFPQIGLGMIKMKFC